MKPSNVDFGKIEGRFLAVIGDGPDLGEEPDFIPEQGTIDFTAAVPYLLDPTADPSPVAIRTTTISGILDDEGYLCTVAPNGTAGARGLWLVATDDADLSVEDWTWSATYKFVPVNGTTTQIPSHSFAVPSGTVQDLSTLARVPSSPGYGLPQAEAAVIRAEAAAVTSAQDAADAEAAALRAEQVAGATDAGVASLLSTTGTATRSELDSRLATKADKSVVDAATASNNADTIVKRNSSGNVSVSDPTSPSHAATKGYVDAQTSNISAAKADKSAVETSLAFKADLVDGKVPVGQLPTDALVTDANVAAQINGAQTGPAIDARINTQVTPQVEQVAADYIASQPAVVDAAAAAVDANPKIASIEAKNTEQDTAIESKRITHIATAKPVTDVASTYPLGVSYFGTSATGWPTQYGTVMTVRWATGRTAQTYSTTSGKTYTRHENGADIWTAFTENSTVGHTHDRISLVGAEARLDSAGQFQYLNPDASLVWQVKTDGTLSHGNVPWARLTGIPTDLMPTKCVRLEAGKWVWDTTVGTHYVIPDHTGALIVRATPWPTPAATPALNW